MYCYYTKLDRECEAICSNCPYGYRLFEQRKEYKCSCGGEFRIPALKSILKVGSIETKYFCPFCGKEMLGLA